MSGGALKCRRCFAEYRSDDVDLKLALARCQFCKTVTDLGGRSVQLPSNPAPVVVEKVERQVPRPERYSLSQTASGIVIHWRWFGAHVIPMAFFAAVWCGFLVFWNTTAIASGASMMALFSVLHVGVGLYLILNVLAGFLNSTTITVSHGEVELKTAPIHFLVAKNVRLTASNVDQFFCEMRVRHGKHSVTYTYTLCAVSKDGKKLRLIKNLRQPDEALWMEYELEKALGIADRPVPGELPSKVA